MSTCNCHSYNWDIGETEPIIMETNEGHKVCIDRCIADVIHEIWENQIDTLGSCCGHGRLTSSIVLAEGEDPEEVSKIISEITTRKFDLFQWKLTNMSDQHEHV